jgi:hypothetical protein
MVMRKERPILFSTSMVQAILEGRKTMTRRTKGLEVNENPDDWKLDGIGLMVNSKGKLEYSFQHSRGRFCLGFSPYGKPGDILWVRETWSYYRPFGGDPTRAVLYKADEDKMGQYPVVFNGEEFYANVRDPWRPSIHMLKSDARIWLKITDVKVERLHNISYEDTIKEGIYECWLVHNPPSQIFGSLWRDINGKDSWELNPWVWVVEFEVLSTTGRPEYLDMEVHHAS